jgi:hypothetical protein
MFSGVLNPFRCRVHVLSICTSLLILVLSCVRIVPKLKKVHDELLNTQFLDVETCSECE